MMVEAHTTDPTMTHALLTVLLLAPLAACSIAHTPGSEQLPGDYMYAFAEPREVAVVRVEPDSVVVAFSGTIPNPCYAFDRVEVDREGDVYDVRVRTRIAAETICIQVIGEIDRQIAVPVEGSGAITLRFSPEIELAVTLP